MAQERQVVNRHELTARAEQRRDEVGAVQDVEPQAHHLRTDERALESVTPRCPESMLCEAMGEIG